MNKIILLGNLCKDIEIRYTKTNKMGTTNTLGVRNNYKSPNGEYGTTFINIKAWGNTAEYLSKYAKKGSRLLVEGRLDIRPYENEKHEKKYLTEVVCESVTILDNKKDGAEQKSSEVNTEEKNDPFKEFGNEVVLTDEDLPF